MSPKSRNDAAGGRPPTILIAGGGTGGHVYPGLAVAEALRALAPGARISFAGTRRGLESVLVPKAGWPIDFVPASGFRGLGPGARLRFVVNFLGGLFRSLRLVGRLRPDVVLGTGGYVGAPVLAAARLLRRRTALQEQNSVPGSANRLLARWADRIYLGFAEARTFFPKRDCLVTGNPVRADFVARTGAAAPAFDGGRPLRLLVFGGSSGARTLNAALRELAPRWRDRDDLELRLQTGTAEKEAVAAAFADFPAARARVDAYILDMPEALAWADLVVCRAGAMTLAELAASGAPAVLVPYPFATDDHQLRNARDFEGAGAALVLEDAACDGPALADVVESLAADPARLGVMAAACARLARPAAAAEIAADLMRLAGRDVRGDGEGGPRVP